MARESDTFSGGAHGNTETTHRLFKSKQSAVRNPAPRRGNDGAKDRASGTRQRTASGESGDAEIWRSTFDGRVAGRSPHRSGENRESDRKTCLSWNGKRLQITVPRLRDRSDAAIWESLWSADLRRQASGRTGLHCVRSRHTHRCDKNELQRLREDREAKGGRLGDQVSADERSLRKGGATIRTKRMKILLASVFLCLACTATPAVFAAEKVGFINVDSAIGPATASYISRSIEEAKRQNVQCLVIQLNTPGGLLDSTQKIVQSFLGSPVPVIVYVAPIG